MSDELPAPISEDEYAAIEAAVMETARGRWFLAEYARRNRNADTRLVLDAVARLEATLDAPVPAEATTDLRLDLIDMAEAISRTRIEIRSLQSDEETDRFVDATEELDAVVAATEKATHEILAAAEKIQEVAWTAMERGEAKDECAQIDELIIDIYTGCSFQDITGQRIQKVVQALSYVESRVNAMIEIWNMRTGTEITPIDDDDERPDAHLLNGPARPGSEVEQRQIDDILASTDPDIVDLDSMGLAWGGIHVARQCNLDEPEDADEIAETADRAEEPAAAAPTNGTSPKQAVVREPEGYDADSFEEPDRCESKLSPTQAMAMFS